MQYREPHYHLTAVSGNRKTGPIPVSTVSADSCPASCALKRKPGTETETGRTITMGCYADGGPLAIHWRKVSNRERGNPFPTFLLDIRRLPIGQVWRHAQAGDTPLRHWLPLAEMVKRRRQLVIWYTHHKHFARIRDILNITGVVINHSADTAANAVRIKKQHGINTVCVLPAGFGKNQEIAGIKVIQCPAEYVETLDCAQCQLCAKDRDYVIGFTAHGSSARKAEIIARG